MYLGTYTYRSRVLQRENITAHIIVYTDRYNNIIYGHGQKYNIIYMYVYYYIPKRLL